MPRKKPKKPSGAQRKKWERAPRLLRDLMVREVGRPEGAKTRADDPPPNIDRWFRPPSWVTPKPAARVDARQLQLRRDLSNIGLPDAKIADLMKIVRDLDEYRGAYHGLEDRTLRRDIATIQKEIWGKKPKRK
jgi:hypothetical protein